jgi:hypothetical protein
MFTLIDVEYFQLPPKPLKELSINFLQNFLLFPLVIKQLTIEIYAALKRSKNLLSIHDELWTRGIFFLSSPLFSARRIIHRLSGFNLSSAVTL